MNNQLLNLDHAAASTLLRTKPQSAPSSRLPQPLPMPEPIVEPEDIDYHGTIRLKVDVTDVERRIFRARETIPVDGAGPLTLLYPQWLPGYHSPQAPIELFAGLQITAGGKDIGWRRHPIEVHAFQVDLPYGADTIEATYQFLSPTDGSQGSVVVSPDLLCLQWNTVVLYPAGYFARRIMIEPSLRLPPGWQIGSALDQRSRNGDRVSFAPVALDQLVDSPVMCGRYFRGVDLDPAGQVRLNIVADQPDLLKATEEHIAPHRELVRQADRLFGARHFNRFEILLALTDEMTSNGVEHHRSCEAITIPNYFTEWETTFARRDTIPHEYVHSWNGKYRRGADSWTPCFHHAIRNSLMWVYEGQTQYWDRVLCARSGLWTREQALQAWAEIAATHEVREGSRWRPMSDTTRDPIIASRSPLPWPSWQRSEDYYTEGALVWLDVDTRIRELTNEQRSLDDFARAFFGQEDGVWTTSTYTFDDVVATLEGIAAFDWTPFFEEKLYDTTAGAPRDGLTRGGYRLVYRGTPSEYQVSKETVFGTTDLLYSIGLSLSSTGQINEVLWNSPAFDARLTAGSQVLEVNGEPYSPQAIKAAVAGAAHGRAVELGVADGKRRKDVTIPCPSGHRYPHLEPIPGARRLLDDILSPL